MRIKIDTKIIWTVENFSSLPSEQIYSDHFVVGGCKWNLEAFPKGKKDSPAHLALYLSVFNYKSLPSGWRRHTKYRFAVLNKFSNKILQSRELDHWFENSSWSWGFHSMCLLNRIYEDSGFLLDGELKIDVEIEVLQVIGKLDLPEETSKITENVHGFILLPSQVKYASRIFERHPEVASDFRPKNPNIRTCYMSLLLSLIVTTCQLPQQMSKDDLTDAYAALGSLKDVGFKLDWLEKKLDEVSEKMEDTKAIETGLQEMEEELKNLKRKCPDMEDLMEKKKVKLSTVKAPISFDDIVD